MSIESIASTGTNQEVTVNLMSKSKAQEEAVLANILGGVEKTADAVKASIQNREAFETGTKLNIEA